jgi:dynamin 1-like protein
MFVPEVAFDLLVKPQIKLLEPPSLRCVELVYEELMKICHNCTTPELQRFPQLHSQLIEVVSELLRERLGPTSEYVSSLIQIQAAYINTNHPDFQAGQAAIAAAGAHPPAPPKAPSVDEEVEEDESASEKSGPTAPNGLTNGHGRASMSSTTVPDVRNNSATSKLLARNGHNRTGSSANSSSSNATGANAHATPLGTSPQNAKETFLNYFFGGPQGGPQQGGMPVSAGPGAQARRGLPPSIATPSYRTNDLLPDLGSARRTGGAPGLDQPSAVYDMKSLGRHLDGEEVVRLTPREEMETNLILSLIASYFNIVRQTIEDLVPKSIMHLLVNFSRDAVQQRLVTQLYKPELFPELLHEDEALVAERTRIKALLDAYKEAFRVLSEVSLKSP